MSHSSSSRTFHELVKEKKQAYLEEEYPEPNQDHPPDVRAIQNNSKIGFST